MLFPPEFLSDFFIVNYFFFLNARSLKKCRWSWLSTHFLSSVMCHAFFGKIVEIFLSYSPQARTGNRSRHLEMWINIASEYLEIIVIKKASKR